MTEPHDATTTPRLDRTVEMTPRRLARLLIASTPSTARQEHGFVFQSGLVTLLDLWEPTNYTDETDAFSIDRHTDRVSRYSFKNMGMGKPVYLGSLDRNATIDKDFYMYVGFWSDFGTNIQRVHVMRIPAERWRSFFPADLLPFTAAQAFAGISNSREDDSAWDVRQRELKARWAAAVPGSPIDVHFKRDHKKQRRVQCSITPAGFDDLFEETFDLEKTLELELALDGRKPGA